MSIDDMFLRDPRVLKLARRLGWSKYETRGRLLDVFALVYDRVDSDSGELVTIDDIDIAADFPGLGDAMIQEELAVPARDRVRVCGATERTKYLATRETSGRAGGLKSAETRRNKAKVCAKVTFNKNEGPSNPSVPDPVPDLASVPEISEISPARAIPPSTDTEASSPPKPQIFTLAQRQKINSDSWEAARVAHEQLRASGVDRTARPWPVLPGGPGKDDLAARTSELCEQLGDEAAVREMHARALVARVEEAKRMHAEGQQGALKYFIPTRVFERVGFWKSAELSPQQTGQSRRAPLRAEPREIQIVRDQEDRPPPIPKWHRGGGS